MKRHIPETDLALYVSGDLSFWGLLRVRLHVDRCERCRKVVEIYRHDRGQILEVTDQLPEGLNWNRLAAEMTANIRVGLAAGECVAPRPRKSGLPGWRPAAVVAGLAMLVSGAWWLNMPAAQTQNLGRALHAVWNARSQGFARRGGLLMENGDESGPVVEATSSGIELRENGSSLGCPRARRGL